MALTRPRASQIITTSADFSDPLIAINKDQTGANNKDIGFVFERGSDTNVAIIWDESLDQFALINTTESGSTAGNVSIGSYANLTVSTLISSGITYPTSDGTNGQVIVTNGSGTLSFTDISTSLSISGDSGTDTVNLLTDTLSFSGTANEITTSVTNNTVTIGLPSSINTNASTASAWATARTITLGGVLSGNVSIDGSSNVTLTAAHTSDPVITLTGAVTGSGTMTNLGNVSISTTGNFALGTDTTGNYVASITNGNYITGGNGGSESAALTLAVDATTTNTASKVVARDASGNFAAGTITASLTGNASTASAWATARTITLGGVLSGNVSINGSSNVTLTAAHTSDPVITLTGDVTGSATMTNLGNVSITATVVDDSHNHIISNVDGLQTALDAKAALAGATFTGNVAGTNLTLSGNLTVNGTTTTLSTTNTVVKDNLIELNNGATSNANDSGIVIERGTTGDNAFIGWDESADKFIVGTTTATGTGTGDLTITAGTLVASTFEGNLTGAVTGNASTATTLQTARTIGGVSFNGSANINLPGVNTAGNQNTTGSAASLTTARTLTIGSTGKTFNGTANVAWSLSEIGVNDSTLTLATSGIATGSQTWTSNQGSAATFTVNVPATNLSATAGTTAGPVINSSTGTNVTIPSASGTASGIVTTGTQTFAGVKTFSSTITGSVSGNAGTATTLQTARTIGGVSFNGSANIDLPGVNTTGNQNTTGSAASLTTARTIGGVSFNGTANINLPGVNTAGNQNTTGTSAGVVKTVTGTTSAELVRGNMADNDQARILVGGTATNAGFLEIATADDGTEPIHVRQYTGVFTTLQRTATLLDGSGNTSFPGTVTAPTFSGALSGNASTATTLQTARTITLGGVLSGSTSFNGSGNVTITAAHTADPVITLTGDVTGSATMTNLGNVSISTTVAANSVALGTDTTGNYVATIAGTANEITVTGSGSETAAVTIALPDDVTIGDTLTVTGNLFVDTNTLYVDAVNNAVGVGTSSPNTYGKTVSNGDIAALGRGLVKFYDSDSSNYVAFKSAATVTSNVTWTLPSADGESGQVLSTDGTGTLTWADGGAGGGTGYKNSTITSIPGNDGNYDLAKPPDQVSAEVPFDSGATDPFGVNLGFVYSAMDPEGTFVSFDYGDGEAYVGA